MKTLETVIKDFKSQTIDGRDFMRLAKYIPAENLIKMKCDPVEGHTPADFTRENILEDLKRDLDFAFEKAIDKRGISAACMYYVIKMWTWILEDGLEDWSDDNYAQYGLPLLKASALKYGFVDEIDGYEGNEHYFSENYEGDDY